MGYLAYGDDAANVLFHVVNERHIRRRSMIFTTNKHPKGWGPMLHDNDLAEAIVDRILHRGRLLKLDGPSMRTKHLAEEVGTGDNQSEVKDRRVSGTGTSDFPEPTGGTPSSCGVPSDDRSRAAPGRAGGRARGTATPPPAP